MTTARYEVWAWRDGANTARRPDEMDLLNTPREATDCARDYSRRNERVEINRIAMDDDFNRIDYARVAVYEFGIKTA